MKPTPSVAANAAGAVPPVAAVVCVRVRDPRSPDRHPYHPARYEITHPAEIAELLAVWTPEPVPERPTGPDPRDSFVCMCMEHDAEPDPFDATDDPAIVHVPPVRSEPLARLLDPGAPDGIPARHRARWVAAAPEAVRGHAGAMARGEDPPRPDRVALAAAFSWQGAVREDPADAASLLAKVAPPRLLVGASTEDLAWAVRMTDRAGLDAAVRFFASEEFTTRHPKRRRVPDTARDLLLRHARSHRPRDLPVLERRLLRAPDDRVRRS